MAIITKIVIIAITTESIIIAIIIKTVMGTASNGFAF